MNIKPERNKRGFYDLKCIECGLPIDATHIDTKFCINNNRVCEKKYKQNKFNQLMEEAKERTKSQSLDDYKEELNLKPTDFRPTNIKHVLRDFKDMHDELRAMERFFLKIISLDKQLKKRKNKTEEEIEELETELAEDVESLLFYTALLQNNAIRIVDNVVENNIWKDTFFDSIKKLFDGVRGGNESVFEWEQDTENDDEGGELIEK